MPRFQTLRRLLSRASQDWQDAVDSLFTQPSRPAGPRPLRVMRLERRRVLSADFAFTGSGLVLSGFDAPDGDNLVVTQQGDSYLFTSEDGWNTPAEGLPPEGVSIDGDTLVVDAQVVNDLSAGISIRGSNGSPLDVTIGNADFSNLDGPVSLLGASSVGQQRFARITAPDAGIRLGVAPSGMELGTFNVVGNLEILSFGSITDAPGTQIYVTGDATFRSFATSPDGDFTGDGAVNNDDLARWEEFVGIATGASKYDGDANSDGAVDSSDYALWRDSQGETGSGGITLADSPNDQFVVLGSVTFDASESLGTHPIDIGSGGWTDFGVINAFGTQVDIVEDAPAEIGQIEAYNFNLTASGEITTSDETSIRVEDSVTLTSLYRDFRGDFNGDLVVDELDEQRWSENTGTTSGASRETGDANGDGMVNSADYVIWRDDLARYQTLIAEYESQAEPEFEDAAIGIMRGGITIGPGALFEAGGLVTFDAVPDHVINPDPSLDLDTISDPIPDLTPGEVVGGLPTDRFNVTVDKDATARFGSVRAEGAIVTIIEDAGAFKELRDGNQDGTVLANIDAFQFNLITEGPITIDDGATVQVGGGSSLAFGTQTVSISPDLLLGTTGSINLADAAGRDLSVEGIASFIVGPGESIRVGVGSDIDTGGAILGGLFQAGGLRFFSPGGETLIAESDDTQIVGWTDNPLFECLPDGVLLPEYNEAQTLGIYSDGDITDAADAVVLVTGRDELGARAFDSAANATFVAGGNITLADGAEANSLEVDGRATFVAGDDADQTIDLGVTSEGAQAGAGFLAGRMRFNAPGVVRVAEDVAALYGVQPPSGSNGTILTSWDQGSTSPLIAAPPVENFAQTLELFSVGSIADDPDGVVTRTGDDATFVSATGDITLADGGDSNVLEVGDLATFYGPAAASIAVGVDSTGNEAAARFDAARLRFSAAGALVRIAEDSDTTVAGWDSVPLPASAPANTEGASLAAALEVYSAGNITDESNSQISVGPDGSALFAAAGDITLADEGAANSLQVDGVTSFVVSDSQSVSVGIASDGTAADADYDTTYVRYYAPNGTVQLAEDGDTVLTNWEPGTIPALAMVTPTENLSQTLELSADGSITDEQLDPTNDTLDVVVRTTSGGNATFVAAESIQLADGAEDNGVLVDGTATLIAGNGQLIDVGVTSTGMTATAAFTAGTLRFSAEGGTVRIAEDDATVLTNWDSDTISTLASPAPSENRAATLELNSAGSITDAQRTEFDSTNVSTVISGDATFVAAAEIELADAPTARNQLDIGGLATFIAGAGQTIDLGVDTNGAETFAQFRAGSLRFSAPAGDVTIAEDNSLTNVGTHLAGWTGATIASLNGAAAPTASEAATFELSSHGAITDADDAAVDITGDATFIVTEGGVGAIVDDDAIVLADHNEADTTNRLEVGGLATFIVEQPADAPNAKIAFVGATSSFREAAATFNAGSLRFSSPAGWFIVAEDSDTHLAGWTGANIPLLDSPEPTYSEVQSLDLLSAGGLTDAADASIVVTGRTLTGERVFSEQADVTFVALGSIDLADGDSENVLAIDGLATFDAGGSLDVGVDADGAEADAQFVAGRLRFSAFDDAVRIAEDRSATVGDLTMTDTPGTVLAGWISENLSPLVLDGSLPAGIPMASVAGSLELLSAGTITDDLGASLFVSDDAAFIVSQDAEIPDAPEDEFVQAIVLADADTSENNLHVGGVASFVVLTGADGFAGPKGVDVGVLANGQAAAATFNDDSFDVDPTRIDSLRFSAPGAMVRVAEDSGTHLDDWLGASFDVLGDTAEPMFSTADIFELLAEGRITDSDDADVQIGARGSFTVSGTAVDQIAEAAAIVLADSGSTNQLLVSGLAQFVVTQPPIPDAVDAPLDIYIGVTDAGLPADAVFNAGSLQFSARGGLVRIAEDSHTTIGESLSLETNVAEDLELTANGEITDDDGADTVVAKTAQLNAQNGAADIVLGDVDATFAMAETVDDDPNLFDPTRFLAMSARNVSVQVDSSVNVRPSEQAALIDGQSTVVPPEFSGTYYLTSTGSVSQVGPETLTAGSMSLASYGAIFMTAIALTRQSDSDQDEPTTHTPNLQVKAGRAVTFDPVGQTADSQPIPDDWVRNEWRITDVPTSTETRLSPVDVENDTDQGTRPRALDGPVVLREGEDPLDAVVDTPFEGEFDDITNEDYSTPELGLTPSRLAERGSHDSYESDDNPNPPPGNSPVDIGDGYSAVVFVVGVDQALGDVVVGDVADATGAHLDTDAARGFVVVNPVDADGSGTPDPGNAYLGATGDITFTSAGRNDLLLAADVVSMSGGVFTAVAGETLSIDTDFANQAYDDSATQRTTLLRSQTGAVTYVGDPEPEAEGVVNLDDDRGPRALLDLSTEEPDAATTGLVRANGNFEQRITLALGSRGEENLLVEVEWADVANVRTEGPNNPSSTEAYPNDETPDPAKLRDAFAPSSVPGSVELADLTQTTSDIEIPLANRDEGTEPDVTYQGLGDEFRVATIRHNYNIEFVANNPAQNTLPTTVRVYNDPYINLYEGANSEQGPADLNSANIALAPRIITVPPSGFFLIIQTERPQQYAPQESYVLPADNLTQPQQNATDLGRAAVASTAETVMFGRVDSAGEWIKDIPGEEWPMEREDAEGDFLREIRDRIDEGPYSEGAYQIRVKTPRGEQLLEEWVKGASEELDIATTDEAFGETALPADPDAVDDTEAPLENSGEEPLDEPFDGAPRFDFDAQPIPFGQLTPQGASQPAPQSATNAAFAAMAAVGVWRRRFNDSGAFKLDDDGVAFTRVRRRRRRGD